MSRLLLTAVAGSILVTSLSAQTQLPVHKAITPKHAGIYRMATGELEPSTPGQRFGPDVIFNASELTNYYSVPGIDQEWLDEGSLLNRNAGNWEQINGMEFVYCSTEADATQNSGTVTFAFYDETIVCTGPTNGGNFVLGGYLCAYDIVGLPLGDANGAIQCWIVTVDLMCGFECPPYLASQTCSTGEWITDQANTKLFGWSFIPRNDNTGPWLSKGGTQAAGIDNSFVWFDQFGALVGCFWFGGTPWANFAMKLFSGPKDCRIYWDCAGLNQMCLIPTPGFPLFTWTVQTPGSNTDCWLLISLSPGELPLPGGTLLINHLALAVPPVLMPNGTVTLDVSAGSGFTIYTQAVETPAGSGPPSASNIPSGCTNGEMDVIQ
ncbi:MAG: hypothetical protein DWQ01_04945 [Planctomycetota bacterium]|nr:MAG: hypothetical protein DWQ01_04945 [Planctomycetota bacterium]